MTISKNIFKNQNILVFGDIILDHFIYGKSDRISPEAPVPVVEVVSEQFRLGGAANVANNIKKLGADCTLIGSIGNDLSAERVKELSKKNSIDFQLYTLPSYQTTTKSRVFINHHQSSRLDYENTKEQEFGENKIFLKKIEKYIKKSSVIIISDYCKGFISPTLAQKIVELCILNNKKIIVDTKKIDLKCFNGVDYITPNVKELGEICKKNIQNEKGQIEKNSLTLLKKYNFKNIVVTRSEKGACIINLQDSIFHSRKKIRVFDVTGAGDSFISIFSLLKSIGKSDIDSLKISTLVGSISVSKPGTYAVNINEIIEQYKNER